MLEGGRACCACCLPEGGCACCACCLAGGAAGMGRGAFAGLGATRAAWNAACGAAERCEPLASVAQDPPDRWDSKERRPRLSRAKVSAAGTGEDRTAGIRSSRGESPRAAPSAVKSRAAARILAAAALRPLASAMAMGVRPSASSSSGLAPLWQQGGACGSLVGRRHGRGGCGLEGWRHNRCFCLAHAHNRPLSLTTPALAACSCASDAHRQTCCMIPSAAAPEALRKQLTRQAGLAGSGQTCGQLLHAAPSLAAW